MAGLAATAAGVTTGFNRPVSIVSNVSPTRLAILLIAGLGPSEVAAGD